MAVTIAGHDADASGRDAAATTGAGDILSSVGTATYEWAVPSDRLIWSDNVADLLGFADPACLSTGRGFARFMAPESPAGRYEAVVNSPHVDRGEGVAYSVTYAIVPRPGLVHWIEDTGRWFAASDGRPLKAHGTVRIVTDRYENERRLREASEIDPLTGQLSRHRFCQVLDEALEDAVKVRGSIGFVIAAIDGLAQVNECYGFDIADELIAAVGRRIRTRLRGGDLLGRLSGNKFGILMRSCQPGEMGVAAERILAAVRDDVILTAAGPVPVTVTMGGVVAPRHASSTAAMIGRAQEALDSVKGRRRGAFEAFQPSPERERARRDNLQITGKIVSALNDRRITLAFQPIVEAGPRRATLGYECLLRVRRPDGMLLPAASIVPLAERLGLIRLVDARVMELALGELEAAPDVHLSVNVSPATVMNRAWIDTLSARLRTRSDLAGRLTVEITESTAIADLDETRHFVARVKDLGARVAIDDFGAGYTSFRNLRRLGVDGVKVDGSFIADFHRNADDRHFVATLLALARHMGLSTVAEWVPNEEVALALAGLGCDALQGHHTGAASDQRPWLASVRAAPLRNSA